MQVLKHTTAALSIGFLAILACMLGSIYIGFQHLEQTRLAWQRDALFQEKVRTAFLMREAIRERSYHLTFAATMDDFFDRDAQRDIYNAKAVDFMLARDRLVELQMTPPERTAMDSLLSEIVDVRASIDQAMELVVENGNSEEALRPMRTALDGQTEILDQINQFIIVVEYELEAEAEAAAQALAETQRNMLILSGCAVALAAIIGLLVTVREARNTRRLRRHRDELAALSTTDALTCIANRRRFDEFLEFEWARAMRAGSEIALVLLDIDHFKNFNDNYGHAAGDDCLAAVSKAMCGTVVRATDLLARYGGEEFACVLPETPLDAAHAVAEKLRVAVADLGLIHEHSSVAEHVTVSIGVASISPQPGDEMTRLFEMADERLYHAKESGRNQVISNLPGEAALAAS